MQNGIPLYTADGELCDWISEQWMARLDRLGWIRILRHKKGRVARCIRNRRPGDPKPVRLDDYLGTRYSFREHLDNGVSVCGSTPPEASPPSGDLSDARAGCRHPRLCLQQDQVGSKRFSLVVF